MSVYKDRNFIDGSAETTELDYDKHGASGIYEQD